MKFISENLSTVNIEGNLDENYPSTLTVFRSAPVNFTNSGTHFGFVFKGTCTIAFNDCRYPVSAGMYFSIPGEFEMYGEGLGFIVTRHDVTGLFYLGGKVEQTGRLKYIDGCSDTLLIPPVVIGYPCMNFLHIPPFVDQTAHTHPSVRVGVVIDGEGLCRAMGNEYPLIPGNLFMLPTDGIHSFHTTGSSLRIIVYHPDSDFGPSDTEHPMINKTFVDGVSASQIAEIMTK